MIQATIFLTPPPTSFIPVSYTHLDVYKRQIFNRQIITYLQVIQTQIVTIPHKTGGSTRVLIRVTRHGTWNISIRIFRYLLLGSNRCIKESPTI